MFSDSQPPKVFICYSHDSSEHEDLVLGLSDRLRDEGIDCNIDQYEFSPPEGWPRWIEKQIEEADFVLTVCTETFYNLVQGEEITCESRSARWQIYLAYQGIYNQGTFNQKFIPVLLEKGKLDHIPSPLRGATHYFAQTKEGYEDLYHRLTNQPSNLKPPVGELRALPPRDRRQFFLEEQEHQTRLDSKTIFPCHNLPNYNHSPFIGREQQLKQLLRCLLSENPTSCISIQGMGGIGKTSLALEVAYRCWEASRNPEAGVPTFNKIIFISAKSQQFVNGEILPYLKREASLQDIFQVILRVLNNQKSLPCNLEQLSFEQQLNSVLSLLRTQPTLLIVDNWETMQEQKEVLAFLHQLPRAVKVIITSRERLGIGSVINMQCLSSAESRGLIEQEARQKGLGLNEEQLSIIQDRTKGFPLAIIYSIGQISVFGYLGKFQEQNGANRELTHFCFEDSVKMLRGEPAHRLLMALALFADAATPEAIIAVAGNATGEGLEILYKLSLVIEGESRYNLLFLTREYALAEMENYPDFAKEARERWVKWYLHLSQPYKSKFWREWRDYSGFEQEWENLRGVMAWCIGEVRYEQAHELWQHLKGYTHIAGYWYLSLSWLAWLNLEAKKRQDQAVLAEILCDQAWALTMIGKSEGLQKAEALLQETENLAREDLLFQFDLTSTKGILSIHQCKFEQALNHLHQSQDLLIQLSLEESQRQRQLTRLEYYLAEVHCRIGEYEESKILYQQVVKQARAIGWQQIEVYSLNWLVELAIEEGNLDEATNFLEQGFPLVKASKDLRSLAFYNRSWAKLEKCKKNREKAQQLAEQALECFQKLGMHSEASTIKRNFQL